MEKIILQDESVEESTTKYLNVFNAKKLELSGNVEFPSISSPPSGSVFVLVRSFKHTTDSSYEFGRYKSYEFKAEERNSDGAVAFCKVIDVEAMSAAEIVVLNNVTSDVAGVNMSLYATTKEVVL